MMNKEEIETLQDLSQDIIAAIGYDLETGSHHFNNEMAKKFHRNHPILMKSIAALSNWVDKQEALL